MSAAPISNLGLLQALVFVVAAGAVSLLLQLDLERRLLWATLRAGVQLALIGQILRFVLGGSGSFVTVAAMTAMVVAASFEAIRRPERRLAGTTLGAFATLTMVGLMTSFYVSRVVVGVVPWTQPRYLIPILGMVLGNALTGLSLALDHLLETIELRRFDIEADLAAGATRLEALREPLSQAVRRGITPILNATSVVGVVSLPGMMTGQILAGAPPGSAVRYQFVVMVMILGATAVATLLFSAGVIYRVTDREHRLVQGVIQRRGKSRQRMTRFGGGSTDDE